MTRISIERDQWSGDWVAYLDGRGSPILRPSTGNLHPATRWTWPSPDAAEAELKVFFAPFAVEFRRSSP